MKRAPRGFTLIELMVVLGIVVITSLIILTSTNKFNSAILLRSLAYQVGLSIREAQLYGVAVHASPTPGRCSIGGTSKFCASFGVHFGSVPLTQYFVFSDVNTNGIYDPAGGDTDCSTGICPEYFKAQYGFTVSNYCVTDNTGASQCAASCPASLVSCTGSRLTSLDVAFKRPNPDAVIEVNGVAAQPSPYASALVIVAAPGGSQRSVTVSLTGQIVVAATGS